MSDDIDKESLKAWRKKLNLNQVEAAAALKTSRRTYQRWESGETPVPGITWLACVGIAVGLRVFTYGEIDAHEKKARQEAGQGSELD